MSMNTNSALIVPAQSPAATNAAPLVFHDAIKPLITIPNVWLWVFWIAGDSGCCAAAWLVLALLGAKSRRLTARAAGSAACARAPRCWKRRWPSSASPSRFPSRCPARFAFIWRNALTSTRPDRTTEEFLYELQGTNLLTAGTKAEPRRFPGQLRPDQVRQIRTDGNRVARLARRRAAPGQRNRAAAGRRPNPRLPRPPRRSPPPQ